MEIPQVPPVPDPNTPPAPVYQFEYRYQPTYPEGHELAGQPMGGEQVIPYNTAEELGQEMAKRNNLMQSEMRKLKAQVPDDEPIPDTAPRRSTRTAPFVQRSMTAEEKLRFAKSITDPDKAEEALDMAIAARFGVSPERLKSFDEGIQLTRDWIEGNKFRLNHPEIADRLANEPALRKQLLEWCNKKDLDYTCENFELALARLTKAGLLSDAPIAGEETTREIEPGDEAAAAADSANQPASPVKRQVAPIASALNNRDSRPASRLPVSSGPLSRAEFEKMSLADVQRRAKDPVFKSQALLIVKQLPNAEVTRLFKIKEFSAKVDALG